MWIFARPPDQVQADDLQGLIRDRVQEGVTLDFKRQFYGSGEGETRKMLRDVASLANANGGLLVIGMAEDGEATAAELIPVPNAEVEANRLIASCATNISDRIAGLRALRIPIQNGDAILVWVPPSYRKPHMITFQGATEFWIRHDRQNVRMSIAEIRAATTATEGLVAKVDQALHERMQVWERSGRELFALMATPLLLQDGRVETTDRRLLHGLSRVPDQKRPGGAWLSDPRSSVVPTLRGVAAVSGEPAIKTLEVYRTGHVEFLVLDFAQLAYRKTQNDPVTIIGWMIAEYLSLFTHFLRTLRDLSGITDPYIFTLVFRGCEGWRLHRQSEPEFAILGGTPSVWDEGPVLLIEGIVAPLDEDPGRTAARIADRFWNAFHYPVCPFFSAEGQIILERR